VMTKLEELARLFATEGARDYLGEAVTQAEHLLPAGSLSDRRCGHVLGGRRAFARRRSLPGRTPG
jgi:predicted HD phosphohydrolase